MKEFVYRINQTDQIYFVNDDWLDFGKKNGLAYSVEKVIGSSLWRHISDMTTRQLYFDIIGKIRRSGRRAKVPFRCDGPAVRRFMELEISALTPSDVEFKGVLIREEPREKVDLLDSSLARSAEILLMCVWCKKVKISEWVEVESAAQELRLFEKSKLPLISHVTCPGCHAMNLNTLIL